jgi:hypothetical protein
MAYKPSKELRECCIAALAGDHEAAKSILKLYRYTKLAREVQTGKPFSNRVRRAIDCLCAGTATEWEVTLPDGSIENLLMPPPPAPGTAVRDRHSFDD